MSVDQPAPEPLGFLHGAQAARRRPVRWQLPTARRWAGFLETVAVLLAGGLAAALLCDLPGVIAAGLAAALTLELGQRAGGASRWWHLLAAASAGAIALALLGNGWRVALCWWSLEAGLGGAALAVLRRVSHRALGAMAARGYFATRVGVVGDGPMAEQVAARLREADPLLLHVLGAYAPAEQPLGRWPGGRGDLRVLLSDCRSDLLDAVVVALEPGDAAGLQRLRSALRPCVQDVFVLAEPAERDRVVALGGTAVRRIGTRPIQGWRGRCKRAIDLGGALVLLILLLPILLLLALLIRLDTPGPVLFRQLRVGYNNQLFSLWKFRSMHVGQADPLARRQTVKGDARVTRVGRVLRSLSLDELPQLLNVLRGEMSLVGPRPHAPGTSVGGRRIHTVVDGYASRHLVRPGITGLAQMRGLRGGLASEAAVAARLASDLEYIETWSLGLDLRILLATVLVELRGSNAC